MTAFKATAIGAILLASAMIHTGAHAQTCGTWLDGAPLAGVSEGGSVHCSTLWDPDGPGPLGNHVVVAGDFDPAQTRAWIEKYFGRIAARPEPKKPEPKPEPPKPEPKKPEPKPEPKPKVPDFSKELMRETADLKPRPNTQQLANAAAAEAEFAWPTDYARASTRATERSVPLLLFLIDTIIRRWEHASGILAVVLRR